MTLDELDELLSTHEIDESKLAHWNAGRGMILGWAAAWWGWGTAGVIHWLETEHIPTIPLRPKDLTS